MRQGGLVREAESAIYCIRCCPHLEPLQQRLGLRMVGKHLAPLSEGNGYYPDRKHFRRVPSLQVILANLRRGGYSRELPYRRRIIYKWIVESLGNFMRQRGNILSAAAENSWRRPACKDGDPALLGRWLIAQNV